MAQELNTKMMGSAKEGEVKPFETQKVYATGLGGFHNEGDLLEVHPLLAAKLVEAGKATEKEPTKKDKK